MTILTHTVVAGMIGANLSHPLGAALGGFISHFLLDIIPHNDYLYLWKGEKNKNPYTTFVSFFVLLLSAVFLLVELLFLKNSRLINILLASVAGILPDAYTGLKVTFNLPDDPFDRFHNRIHNQRSLAENFFNRGQVNTPTSRKMSLAENFFLLKGSPAAKKGWLIEMTLELIILIVGLVLLIFSLRST